MTRSSSKLLFLVILPALAFGLTERAAFAQGGPPMLTDDPGTPGNRHWEINTAFTMEKSIIGKDLETPLLDVNYGLRERIQLKLEFPYHVVTENGEKTKSGLGSYLVGAKWRFIDRKKHHGFSMSMYPQFEYKTSSSIRRGINDRGNELLLPVEVVQRFGPLDVNLEGGFRFQQRDKNGLLYGILVGHNVSKRLELLAEIHGEPNRDFRKDNLVLNFGARYKLSKHYTFLFSSGRSLRPSTQEGALNLVLYAGLRFAY